MALENIAKKTIQEIEKDIEYGNNAYNSVMEQINILLDENDTELVKDLLKQAKMIVANLRSDLIAKYEYEREEILEKQNKELIDHVDEYDKKQDSKRKYIYILHEAIGKELGTYSSHEIALEEFKQASKYWSSVIYIKEQEIDVERY